MELIKYRVGIDPYWSDVKSLIEGASQQQIKLQTHTVSHGNAQMSTNQQVQLVILIH